MRERIPRYTQRRGRAFFTSTLDAESRRDHSMTAFAHNTHKTCDGELINVDSTSIQPRHGRHRTLCYDRHQVDNKSLQIHAHTSSSSELSESDAAVPSFDVINDFAAFIINLLARRAICLLTTGGSFMNKDMMSPSCCVTCECKTSASQPDRISSNQTQGMRM